MTFILPQFDGSIIKKILEKIEMPFKTALKELGKSHPSQKRPKFTHFQAKNIDLEWF